MTLPVKPPLDGDVLGSGDVVHVAVKDNPVLPDRRLLDVPAGLSIAEIVSVAMPARPRVGRLVVYLGDDAVSADVWHAVRPKPGTHVRIVAVPAGGGGRILRSVATIATALLAAAVAGPIAGALFPALTGTALTVATGVIGAGLTLAGSLAVNALFPLRTPQLGSAYGDVGGRDNTATSLERAKSYSIGGARNDSQPWGSIPAIFGRHRHSPYYAAAPFTEVVGDEQYLRLLFVWGYGPLSLSDFRIGETPLSSFEDVEVEHFEGTPADGSPSLYPGTVFEEQLSVELEPSVGNVRVTAADVDELSVDIVAPSGVFRFRREDGERIDYNLDVRLEYRRFPDGPWVQWGNIDIRANQDETLRFGARERVSRGQYEVRVTRRTPLFSGDDTVVEQLIWTAVRGTRNEAPIRFGEAPLAITALRIRASAQLSGTVDTFNGIAQSRAKSWNGAAWVDDQVTNNPADLFRLVLQGPANAQPVPDSGLDMPSIQAWADHCIAAGYAFNQVRDFETSVFDLLKDITAAGRASPSLINAKWGVIFEGQTADAVQHFTPRNSRDFRSSRAFTRSPHGLKVRFINEDRNYLQDERIVYDDGFSAENATRFEGVEFPGVTDPDAVWRFARRRIAEARLRREVYELTVDWEHLVATRGDKVRVTYDVPLWGLTSGRVKAVAGQVITLDEVVTLQSAVSYGVQWRNTSGVFSRAAVSGVGETSVVTLADTGDVPAVGDLIVFGEAGLESADLRITAVEPQSELEARLTLVDDAPGILTADQGAIPAFDSQITIPPDPFSLPPQDLRHSEFFSTITGGVRAGVHLSWRVPRFGVIAHFEAQYRRTGDQAWRFAGQVISPQTFFDLFDLEAGTYDFRVRSLFADNTSSAWTEISSIAVAGLLAPPPDVANVRIAVIGDVATLSWQAVDTINVAYYTVRFSPELTGVTWGSAATLIARVEGTTVQVPALIGTYLVKAISFQGVTSVSPGAVSSNVASITALNVVETVREDPGFAGVKTDVEFDPSLNGIRLSSPRFFFEITDFFGVTDFFNDFSNLSGTGIYEFSQTVDLGETFTSRISSQIRVFGVDLAQDAFSLPDIFAVEDIFFDDPGNWDVTQQIRTTIDDPAGSPLWSEWEDFIVGDYTARGYQFRLRLDSLAGGVSPIVTALSATVDMPDRVEAAENLSVPIEGLTVIFDPPFRRLDGVSTSEQDLATGDYAVISNKGAAGFDIAFRDAAGQPIERTFDYVAKGFGRVAS